MKKLFSVLIFFLFFVAPAFAAAPVCLFTDVLSGPATGGEGGNGIYLSIFGKNFGSAQGTSTVTVNGTAVAQYLVWGHDNDVTGNLDQIGVQVASATAGTGNIVVTTPGGSCSNLTFTVRSGRIWYIGPGIDNDSPGNNCTTLENGTAGNGSGGSGSYANPWTLTDTVSIDLETDSQTVYTPSTQRTIATYYPCLALGDTLVFLNGVSFLYGDGTNMHAAFDMDRGVGSSTSFFTLMARPGASVQLGSQGGAEFGIRDYADTYVVVSGLSLTGSGVNGEGIEFNTAPNASNMRMVGTKVTCPDCWGPAAAVGGGLESDTATGLEILGNAVTDVSCADSGGVSNKQYHSMYFFGNDIEVGWNKIYSGCAYNGIQINYYTDESIGFGNLSIHDNDISGANGAGINLASVDPAQGYINIYNNVIHHVGLLSASDGGSFHTCIAFPGEAPSAGAGTANVYNNTMYDCSSYLNTASDANSCAVYMGSESGQTGLTVNLVNNIVSQPTYTYTSAQDVYLCGTNVSSMLGGTSNLFYSASTPGSAAYATTVGSIKNPLFISTSTPNLNLQSTSPAIEAGSGSLYSTMDFNGVVRLNPPSIGAFEPLSASSAEQITLSATPSPATAEEPVTLTATVVQTGSSVPTGSINFLNGSVSLGQASLDSQGTATLVVSGLSAGSYSMVASYSGDSNYPAGKSGAVPLQVLSPTTTSLSASPNPVTAGQALALTATVDGSGSAVPAGTVSFLNGTALLGTGTLNSSGVATLSTASLADGTYSLTAKYTGNASFLTSTSAAVLVTVSAPASPTLAELTPPTPPPGSTLAGPSVTFAWTAASGASGYYLWLGSTGVGSSNIYASGELKGTSVTATGLPTNGKTVYARLITSKSGILTFADYTYTAATQAALTTPAPGSTLSGPSVTFTWTAAAGATGYYLRLGSTGVGSGNLYASGAQTGTSVTDPGLTGNGETIYARLFTYYGSVVTYADYTYTAATPAALTSPKPGSTLSGPSVTFTWTTPVGATGYYLRLGSTGVGSGNLYASGAQTGTSVTDPGLTGNGETIYARLFTYYGSVMTYADYTYTAATPAALTSPKPGSTLSGPSVTFTWTTPVGATGYYLRLGSTGVGSGNLYASGAQTGTSVTDPGLPTNGETIYARLFTYYGSVITYADYSYTAH